jgi:hypothetical protein
VSALRVTNSRPTSGSSSRHVGYGHGLDKSARYVGEMAPGSPRFGRIYGVRFVPPTDSDLFAESGADQVLKRLERGSRISRYRRTWLIGRTEFADRVLTGRIGYIGEDTVTEVWDDELRDFRDEPSANGLTTVFGVNVDTLQGLVQERKPAIGVESVNGALEDLMSAGHKPRPERWTIESVQGVKDLALWLRTVTRVTSVKLTVKAPNPHYENEPDLEDLMNAFEADVVRMEIESDTGVNTGAGFLADTQRHIDRGYGEARYAGVRVDGSGEHRTSFNTSVGIEELNDEVPVGDNGEVDPTELRNRLRVTVEELQTRLANEDRALSAEGDAPTTDSGSTSQQAHETSQERQQRLNEQARKLANPIRDEDTEGDEHHPR